MSKIIQDTNQDGLQKLFFKDLDQISSEDLSVFQTDFDGQTFDSLEIPELGDQASTDDKKSKKQSSPKEPKANKDSEADNYGTDPEGRDQEASDKSSGRVSKRNKKESSSKDSQDIDVQALQEEARQKGIQEGRKEAEQELQTTIQAFSKGIEEISRLRESIYTQSKQDMISMVMSVVSKVIQVEVTEKEEIIEKTIQKALESAIQSDEYHIKVNPKDYELVNEKKPLFVARIRGLGNIVFEPDSSISRGGCKVESDQGEVDATLETQLEEINKNFLEMIKAESNQ